MTHSSLYVVQLTDSHLFSRSQKELLGVNTDVSFQAVLKAVVSLDPKPDLVMVTGDLSQDGSAASYQRCRELLSSLDLDTYWLPGNHDDNAVMVAELGEMASAGRTFSSNKIFADKIFADKVIAKTPWRIVLLDSSIDGEVGGYLAEEELQRLEAELELATQNQQYAAIALHHPPFLMQSRWLDTSTLANPEQLLERLDRFDCVRVVLFGHVHQEWEQVRNGVTYMACPSTCVQFQPRSDSFALETIAPGYRQLWLHPDGSIETLVTRVEAAALAPNALATGY